VDYRTDPSGFAQPAEERRTLLPSYTLRLVPVIAAGILLLGSLEVLVSIMAASWLVPASVGAATLLALAFAIVAQLEAEKVRSRQIASVETLRVGTDRRRRLYLYDPETAILQRWYFEMRVEEELERARRYGQPLSVVVLRLARPVERPLKETEMPDAAVAQRAARAVRSVDLAAGLGPFEYGFCLPNTPRDGACAAASRIGVALSDCALMIGIACYPQDHVAGGSILTQAYLQLEPFEAAASEITPRVQMEDEGVPSVRLLTPVVNAGEAIEIQAQVQPYSRCDFVYITPSGRKAPGGGTCYANADGLARWRWRVSRNTKAGQARVKFVSEGRQIKLEVAIEPAAPRSRPTLLRLAS
jgi:GGDEF domain-containing protein